MKKNNFIIYFIENNSPKVKIFKTEKTLNDFIKKFNKKVDYDANWIDLVTEGRVIFIEEGLKD